MRYHKTYFTLSAEEEKQIPMYLSESELQKETFSRFHPQKFKGTFEEWDNEEEKYVLVQKPFAFGTLPIRN